MWESLLRPLYSNNNLASPILIESASLVWQVLPGFDALPGQARGDAENGACRFTLC